MSNFITKSIIISDIIGYFPFKCILISICQVKLCTGQGFPLVDATGIQAKVQLDAHKSYNCQIVS